MSPSVPSMPMSQTPLRARLKSNASLFVPGDKPGTAPATPVLPCVAPECTAREAAKGPVRGVIESAFTNKLSRVSMCDMPSHTDIEVVVHAGPADMCKFAGQWMIDPEARAQALFALMTMYQMLGPQIISIEPSANSTQLFIGYSGASPDQICAEFWEYGYCAMESFIITIVMQPWGDEASQMAPSSPVPGKEALTAPVLTMAERSLAKLRSKLAPAHGSDIPTDPSDVSLKCGDVKQASLESGSDDVSTAAGSERSDSPPPTPIKTPLMKFRPRSGRACWADIDDD